MTTLILVLLFCGAVSGMIYAVFVMPNCWHDWQVVRFKRQSALHADINAKVRPLPLHGPLIPGCDYAGEPWFETRVCLKCHAVDDQIAREEYRYREQLAVEDARKALAEEVLGRERGKRCKQTLANYDAAMKIVQETRAVKRLVQ